MHIINKLVIYLVTCGFGLLLFYNIKLPESNIALSLNDSSKHYDVLFNYKHFASALVHKNRTMHYNVWCIYAKVDRNSELRTKFNTFLTSLLAFSSVPIHLHVISDEASTQSGQDAIRNVLSKNKKRMLYTFYDVHKIAEQISDIVTTLTPHFSSQPGSYYSDALFFVSLGLHRIAPNNMYRAILIDCDVKFRGDIKELFQEFKKFQNQLFGLAPELTPVYRHVLYQYRQIHPDTTFGNPYNPLQKRPLHDHAENTTDAPATNSKIQYGFPGYNSGVVLLNLEALRKSKTYPDIVSEENVKRLTEKYHFKGHLGDQDFYTILGHEYPDMIYTLSCLWNRQLCTWWKDRGYSDVFDYYFYCPGKVRLYHGNCNTNIPSD